MGNAELIKTNKKDVCNPNLEWTLKQEGAWKCVLVFYSQDMHSVLTA